MSAPTPVRLVWRTADMLMPPWPGLRRDACGRCRMPVYVDTGQPTPTAFADATLVCVPCALADPDLRLHVEKTWKAARAANSL